MYTYNIYIYIYMQIHTRKMGDEVGSAASRHTGQRNRFLCGLVVGVKLSGVKEARG